LVAEAAQPALLAEIEGLVRRIAPAGALGGLAQCLLRMTVPGVPDLYQGCELWDLSLVDPDNRRPVDWAARRQGLSAQSVAGLAATWRDGRIKQALIARILALRRRLSPLFEIGDYRPVKIEGPLADAMIAFVRRTPEAWLLVVAPHLAQRLPLASDGVELAGGWHDTAVVLEEVPDGRATLDLHDRDVMLRPGRVPLDSICGALPIGVAWRDL
jgi:maltooligosyltrehalose synthase